MMLAHQHLPTRYKSQSQFQFFAGGSDPDRDTIRVPSNSNSSSSFWGTSSCMSELLIGSEPELARQHEALELRIGGPERELYLEQELVR